VLRLVAQLHRGDDRSPDGLRSRQAWDEIVAREDHAALVAEVDGTVVGTLHLVVVPTLTHDGAPWAIVENMVVDEDGRGHGVGTARMGEAERRARAAGCYKVQLLSAVDRSGAHAFYERQGFELRARGYRKYF